MGNTCCIIFAIISSQFLQSSYYKLNVYLRFFLLNYHPAGVIFKKKFPLEIFFILLVLNCEKPYAESGFLPLKVCMNPGTRCKPYKSLYCYTNYTLSYYLAELYPILVHYRSFFHIALSQNSIRRRPN